MTMTTNMQPKTANPSHSKEVEAFAGIEAAPLHLPNLINVRPKSSEIEFRWGNRTASDGLRYAQLIYSGFVPAIPQDVKDCPQILIKDGKVIYGDLILMKIDAKKYYGALKHNHNVAIRSANRHVVVDREGNSTDAAQAVRSQIGAPPQLRSKLQAFIPSDQEIEGLTGADKDK